MTALRFLRFAFAVFFFVLAIPATAHAACINPAGDETKIIFNTTSKQFQYCDGSNWIAMHPAPPPDAPTGCPTIGNVCSDGSVYAGLSPDGNVAMYTTPADAGLFSWNDGTVNPVDTAMVNCTTATPGAQASCRTGAANTALLVGLGTTPSPAPYVAARHCDALVSHGRTDWYLPAQDELNVLRVNRVAIGGFNLSGSFPAGYYWSSSEDSGGDARLQGFSVGNQSSNDKDPGLSVRCVRKVGGSAPCANPAGVEGQMIYNPDNRVLQGCAGGAWRALGPINGTALPSDFCDTIGEVCRDGSVYAGLSPDGSEPMYTTPADAGQFSWNDGSTNWVDTAMASCTGVTIPGPEVACNTGEANTALLVGLGTTPSPAPYVAARHCDALTSHGQTDWYLPAQNEIGVMYSNRVAIGGFDLSGAIPNGRYWSSSENNGLVNARSVNFANGLPTFSGKNNAFSIRCTRKQPTHVLAKLQCSNPVRDEGTVVFSSALKIMQYCDGVNWVSIGQDTSDPCLGSPSPGAVCADGSVYAGLSPDGNVPMFTTPADAGLGPWNNGNFTGYVTTGQTNANTGEANTVALLTIDSNSSVGGIQPHQAAQNCAALTAHGHSDWYLPAQNELSVLYTNRVAIGGFNLSGTFPAGMYWTSTEFNNNNANSGFGAGLQFKNSSISYRCVRK